MIRALGVALALVALPLVVGAQEARNGGGQCVEQCIGEPGPPGRDGEPGTCEGQCQERPPCAFRLHAASAANPCNIRVKGKRGKLVLERLADGERWQFTLGRDGKRPAGLVALVAALGERAWCVEDLTP